MSTASNRCQTLKNRKKSSKTRLTKARNRLGQLLKSSQDGIRRAANKVTLEFGILEKVIYELKEVVVLGENEHETDSIIENLDK